MHTRTHTHTLVQIQLNRLGLEIWDQETNYPNYSPFPFFTSVYTFFLFSVLAGFAFVSVLACAFPNMKLLQSSWRRWGFLLWPRITSCLTSKQGARIPLPWELYRHLNKDACVETVITLCLKNPKQKEFKALGLAYSAKQFILMRVALICEVTRPNIC